ncbi:Uncharacterised protein [Vibrio cholerae]|nr:Uncharacterised protein [Vibrio cholerae]CSI81965.1 Uncharacterised protein [Vibrio cholerae]
MGISADDIRTLIQPRRKTSRRLFMRHRQTQLRKIRQLQCAFTFCVIRQTLRTLIRDVA